MTSHDHDQVRIRHELGLCIVAAMIAAMFVGCSSNNGNNATSPGITPDGGPDIADGGIAEHTGRPPPDFLDPTDYADLVTIDPSLPFGVTRRHLANKAIVGSRWGRHGGPMITTNVYGSGGSSTPKVVKWSIPDAPTAAATSTTRSFVIASGIPKTHFYGADGMADLPFGPFALLSYTGPAAPFSGEALLYSEAYDAVTSRAKVNGFYSGVGLVDGARGLVVYSGLSALSAKTSSAVDNGLYAADVCEGTLAAPAPCPAPRKLFGWTGESGPVVTDAHGNVFVGASLSDEATSDAVFGFTKARAFGDAPTDATKLIEIDSMGTASLAAVAPADGLEGWVLGLGYDAESPVYAGSFIEVDDVLAKGSVVVPTAITRSSGVEGLSVFTDDEGDLWLAVATSTSGAFLELRRTTR